MDVPPPGLYRGAGFPGEKQRMSSLRRQPGVHVPLVIFNILQPSAAPTVLERDEPTLLAKLWGLVQRLPEPDASLLYRRWSVAAATRTPVAPEAPCVSSSNWRTRPTDCSITRGSVRNYGQDPLKFLRMRWSIDSMAA